MKFAKELEQDLVPEWRLKYLDYKAGKKQVKSVVRAVNRANATPRTPLAPSNGLRTSNGNGSSLYGSTTLSPSRRRPRTDPRSSEGVWLDGAGDENGAAPQQRTSPNAMPAGQPGPVADAIMRSPPVDMPPGKSAAGVAEVTSYDSFVATPPLTKSQTFELPEPALPPEAQSPPGQDGTFGFNSRGLSSKRLKDSFPINAYEVGQTTMPTHRSPLATIKDKMSNSSVRPFVRRVFTISDPITPSTEGHWTDVDMVAVDQVRLRQKEFFAFMDQQLEKVETFYKLKEDEAGARLKVLREQLHEMRNRRIQEVSEREDAKKIRKEDERAFFERHGTATHDFSQEHQTRDQVNAWLNPLERVFEDAKAKAFGTHLGPNSKALRNMEASPILNSKMPSREPRRSEDRDYVRRPQEHDIPYRTAKAKLKLALQEFYRGMELLKSYALLNRTAFRKLNKKYDKAIDAHPRLRYTNEKVSKAWFVRSDVLDAHIQAVEDVYARYFEKGNQKVATGKLRSSTKGRSVDRSASAFRNGLLLGTGAVFTIQGLVNAADLLNSPNTTLVTQTSYLLQLYGGYFLALYLFSWFCLDASIWNRHKINYAFVFEFDPRNNLDWRQLAEFPSFLLLVMGVFIWLNFSRYGTADMFLYYPVVLISLTAAIIFFPGPFIFHKSRGWFVYSHWRLVLAGLYPVEFRDFFLGDMYCSLTYFMSNIELFFCLYAHHWDMPSQCNSTHSRLLGFFSALPGIWRALQCIRRYYDTRNVFPHLVNCGKYSMTILYYVTLSLYRIDQTRHKLILFTTFATINAIYCSIWDILMDWSLLQPHSKTKFLRDVRGYKSTWWYYGAMTIDPILRCNWIFYSIYTHDLQHSTIVSFLVAFSEVTRRGVWTLFRVENEHCANVARFKAFRDIPLPYELETEAQAEDAVDVGDENATESDVEDRASTAAERLRRHISQPSLSQQRTRASASGVEVSAQQPSPAAGVKARHNGSPLLARTISRIVAEAHTQDFEKKRRPTMSGTAGRPAGLAGPTTGAPSAQARREDLEMALGLDLAGSSSDEGDPSESESEVGMSVGASQRTSLNAPRGNVNANGNPGVSPERGSGSGAAAGSARNR